MDPHTYYNYCRNITKEGIKMDKFNRKIIFLLKCESLALIAAMVLFMGICANFIALLFEPFGYFIGSEI